MELTQILQVVDLCQGLSHAQMARLAALSEKASYDAEAAIFQQDDPGDAVYIIAQGQVEIRVHDSQGADKATVYLGQGQTFGEMALLDQGTRSASVVAIEPDTQVYSISRQAFTHLCEQDTAIGYIMMRNLALDLSFKLRHRNAQP